MPLYDVIGQEYSSTRVPDLRIVQAIADLLTLPKHSIVADIGAGTGGYSHILAQQGFWIYAVEPSSVMQAQAVPHPHLKWFIGSAENLPLPDNSVDAAVSILSMHHFCNLEQSCREIHRVVRDGALVFFTFDIRLSQPLWLNDYFPWLREDALRFPPLATIAAKIEACTQRQVETFPFHIPHNLSDMFAAAAWRRPEMYLNSQVRAGISSFAIVDNEMVQHGVQRLAADLDSGQWDVKYGTIRVLTEIDAGYRFLRATLTQ
ncbi:class I SAM-dependent methyltransferase [aff. Roholtiella sp. LEGE 12411]|uniref:class I SAM-dependent methyltransferase n=1 Tax=aff. Roholtiella sp. LEGE 12411 TaxID=1828822 RepID=UPI00187F28B5|nr:class I SAM-dependent methyltransferase [aff. Roholtiella sp. LEGE 12411]MBE9038891.1 class I SAM-dependent methyltransferase [aff. Roholtiella sp. LEGE 12411]